MPPAKKPTAKKPAAKRDTRKAIRNIRFVECSVRLESGRRIALRPRGQRGDTAPITATEMKDPNFGLNKDLLFEVITMAEAEGVQEKQATNLQSIHPALAQMRNAKGEEYAGEVRIATEEQAQGTHVASIDERGMITRAQSNGSEDNPIRERVTLEDRVTQEKLDENARRTDIEGPAAGLGGLKVTKSEVQNT